VARRRAALTRIALLGVGEAGGAIAADLVAAGVEVRAWDPAPRVEVAGLELAASAADAVAGAEVVLSVNTASAALEAARGAAPGLAPGAVYADANTAAPRLKRELADVVPLFADVALISTVPGRGVRTPALASGEGAETFARVLRPLGMPVEVVDGGPGSAAARKLLRSVFMKGLAAALVESLRAGEAAGCEEWLRGDLDATLGEALVTRLVEGSSKHAVRRVAEMAAAEELLEELDVTPRIAAAARGWLEELATEGRDVAVR
jgi:3-hydroxyisobutyrate dehydrogenase-like beta-hydroxyacid dehydrogenase